MNLVSSGEPVLTQRIQKKVIPHIKPLDEAVAQLHERQKDTNLRREVEHYLQNDIPEYLHDGKPALMLMRYVASPNLETLRFLQLAQQAHMRAVISTDTKDIFSPQNHVKKALIKMPVVNRVTYKGTVRNEHIEYVSVADCNTETHRPFNDIYTVWGENLVEFHGKLFKQLAHAPYEICNDTEWVNRHHRGKLLEHYKKLLALFLTHGIMCEDYVIDDKSEAAFVDDVLNPAYEYIRRTFGHEPLIAELVPRTDESPTYWVGYPVGVRDIVKKKCSMAP